MPELINFWNEMRLQQKAWIDEKKGLNLTKEAEIRREVDKKKFK